MRRGATILLVSVAVLAVVGAGCSSSSDTGATSTTRSAPAAGNAQPHAVGELTQTFVDPSRPTPANGSSPQTPQRALVTTILYPATGPAADTPPASGAAPDHAAGPYPLVVFSHGLGANPQVYLPLLRAWAEAGYVVAAPRFPLSSSETPGGPNAGDVVHQPGDVSFVITSVLKEARAKTGTLSGLVDPDQVAAAGHSNGGITTLGIAANTCCHDRRVKTAIVMAGTATHYPGGKYDFREAPPLLVVHGTDDSLVPYTEGVAVFNQARGPKALLTVRGGDHLSSAGVNGPAATPIQRSTVDFLDRYLRGDAAAGARLPRDATSDVTTLDYAPKPGSTTTIATTAAPKVDLRATVTPSTGLRGGQQVTVTWRGYTPGKVVNVLQCSADDKDLQNSQACDFTKAQLLHPDPTGAGSLVLEIVEGKVGTGTCDAAHQGCFVVVNNASSSDPAMSKQVPITFGP